MVISYRLYRFIFSISNYFLYICSPIRVLQKTIQYRDQILATMNQFIWLSKHTDLCFMLLWHFAFRTFDNIFNVKIINVDDCLYVFLHHLLFEFVFVLLSLVPVQQIRRAFFIVYVSNWSQEMRCWLVWTCVKILLYYYPLMMIRTVLLVHFISYVDSIVNLATISMLINFVI